MQIRYRSNKLRKVCENAEEATRKYGSQMAEKIHQRIDEISAADDVELLVRYEIGRCHPLHGNREGQYAMNLTHPYRLVFIKKSDEVVSFVQIEQIEDYH